MLILPRRFAAVAIVLSLGIVRSARAEVENPYVRAGMAAYESLEYERAVASFERARRDQLSVEERTAALRTLASCHVALGQEAEARADFEELLAVAPGFTLDRATSPRIRMVFEEARARVRDATDKRRAAAAAPGPTPVDGPPAAPVAPASAAPAAPAAVAAAPIVPAPAPAVPGTLAVRLDPARPAAGSGATVRLEPPRGAARIDLSTRIAGQADFHVRTLYPTTEPLVAASVAGGDVAEPALELFAVALSGAGAELARAGSPSAPLRFDVDAAERPIYKRGWFWGVIGGVAACAVAAGITAAVLTRDGQLYVVPR